MIKFSLCKTENLSAPLGLPVFRAMHGFEGLFTASVSSFKALYGTFLFCSGLYFCLLYRPCEAAEVSAFSRNFNRSRLAF